MFVRSSVVALFDHKKVKLPGGEMLRSTAPLFCPQVAAMVTVVEFGEIVFEATE